MESYFMFMDRFNIIVKFPVLLNITYRVNTIKVPAMFFVGSDKFI